MTLPKLSIKRPVMACMLSCLFILFGVLSYFNIPVQENPDITYPIIAVKTMMPGADASLVNEVITKPTEKVLNSISGIVSVDSSSKSGESTVTLKFKLGTDMSAAYNEVESHLQRISGEMPKDARAPVISKASVSASPVFLMVLYGDQKLSDITRFAHQVVVPKLENIPGVASVNVVGVDKMGVYVDLNLKKMAALKLTPSDVQGALHAQHVNVPGGSMVVGKKEYDLNLDLQFHSISALKNLVVAYRDGAPVYLSEIAAVRLDFPSKEQYATYDGKPAVGINIIKKSDGDTVSIAKAVEQRLSTTINPLLPAGLKTGVVFNEADYILDIAHGLEQDIWLSVLAAALVIFFFLKNFRSTLIITASIPVSLLGAVAAIHFFNYSFNIVTLLGLILLVGVVVDDAIVVLENIFSKFEGKSEVDRKKVATEGANQVVFAVLASSLALVSIFLPVVFMGGIIGLFFKSFAVVVTAGVIISLLVALTLTPVLCSTFMRVSRTQGGTYRFLEGVLSGIDRIYHAILRFVLRFRWLMVLLAVAVVFLSAPIFHFVGKEFMPANKNSGHFSVTIQTPQGVSKAYTMGRVREAETVLNQTQGIASYFSSVSSATKATLNVRLKPQADRKLSQAEIMSAIQQQLQNIPGAEFFMSHSGQASYVTFVLMGQTQQGVLQAAYSFYEVLSKHPELGQFYLGLSRKKPAYKLNFDRILAKSMGISASEVANTLSVLGGTGVRVGHFTPGESGNQRYNILFRAASDEFVDPSDLSRIYLRSDAGQLVRLDTLASLETSLSNEDINRTNLNYSVAFSAVSKEGLGKTVAQIKSLGAANLPQGIELKMTGNAASMDQTVSQVSYTVMLILLLMYIVLASQFNSFIQPLIVMVALPLAVIGGVLVLWITGMTLNIYSVIGMLLLMGLVAKNSILLIDRANQYRQEGLNVHDALSKACPERMRPVLMTSCAIILAMLPAAISSGAGSEAHRTLAVVIIGGMVSSTILSLMIVPSVYSLVAGGLNRVEGWVKRAEAED